MTTKERLHQIIDAIPEEELPGVLDTLATSATLARAYILSSPEWMAAIEEARREKESGVPLVKARDYFAALKEQDQHDKPHA